VAQHRPRSTAFLFDGNNWTAFKDMQQLVESRFVDVAARIDNARFGRDSYTKMRIDNAGRIWLVEWTSCGVYDGQKWFDVVSTARKQGFGMDRFHHCLPLDNGARMLLSHSLMAWVEHDQLKIGRFEPKVWMGEIESDYTTRSGLWLDSTSRVWLPNNSQSCYVLSNLDDIQLISESGYPRFEDSAGCIWFLNDFDKQLVIRNRNGSTLSLHEDTLHSTSAVVEDHPGSVWVGTLRGLLHVVKEAGNNEIGFSLRKIKHYQREVPNGSCLEMFVDRERNLWFHGPGPTNYRLYRIQLPEK
jgi:ligand-binding sensor domain-containing protein